MTPEEIADLKKGINPEALDFIKVKLTPLLQQLDLELSEQLDRKMKKGSDFTEEEYYRIVGKVYKVKYTDKKLKDLIYIYKLPKELDLLTEDERKKIKNFLIQCNTALILKIMSGIMGDKTIDSAYSGELIAEGFKALTEAFDRYEVNFTHDKSTKNTSITFKEVNDEGLVFNIESNKPFGTLDITVRSLSKDGEKNEETLNRPMEWSEENGWYKCEHLIPHTETEYNYLDDEDLKITPKVSKKVGHPSTFFTNSVYFALKNYATKTQSLSINSNSWILKNQVSKLQGKYEEKFHKEPSLRWIAYILLTQNNEIKILEGNLKLLYLKISSDNKISLTKEEQKIYDEELSDIELPLYEEKGVMYVLCKNKSTRRLVMMRNKSATEKNKKNFDSFGDTITGVEDLRIYFKEFEKKLQRKVKEIESVTLFVSQVDRLDRQVGSEDGGTTLGDLIGDEGFTEDLKENINLQYNKEKLLSKAKQILTPREYFYFIFYMKGLSLTTLSLLGLYQDSGVTEVKTILRKAFSKLTFWLQYKEHIN